MLAFTNPFFFPANGSAYDIATADFNGDEHPDLVTANYYDGDVSVLLNDGHGNFGDPSKFAVGKYAFSVAVGDFDEDGNMDVTTSNLSGYDGITFPSVSVLLGDGNGSFQAEPAIGVGLNPMSIAVGDFNADGHLDLAVAGTIYGFIGYYGVLNVHLGDGQGHFAPPDVRTVYNGSGFDSVVADDLDGDGADDLVVLDHSVGTPRVFFGDRSGFVRPPIEIPLSPYVYTVALGDVNGDQVGDIVAATNTGIQVMTGDGHRGFGPAQILAADSWPWEVALGDVTGDGHDDIVSNDANTGTVQVLYGDGNGTFSSPVPSAIVGARPSVVGDFDGDGWLDIGGGGVYVMLNDQSWPPPGPALPAISISDATVTEGNTATTTATFTLTLSTASSVAVTVQYATANNTASAGSDYVAASGTITIPAGQLSRSFTVAVKGDRLGEPTETFSVNLSSPSNANIRDGQGIGTINDDEPRISISDVTATEGSKASSKRHRTKAFTFTVTLSAAYDQPVTMSFQTVNGTATTANDDYVGKNGTLTFAPGETTKTITIEVTMDRRKESHETFYLDLLGNSSNSWFTKNRGLGTILNDD